MTASLRSRIFLATTVAMSAVVLSGSGAVWLGARELLQRTLDDEVRIRGHGLAHQPMRRGPPPRRADDEDRRPPQALDIPPEFRREEARFVLQVVDPRNGRELSRSPGLPTTASLVTLLPPGLPDERPCTVRLPDGREFRLQAFSPRGPGRRGDEHEPPPIRILVAADLAVVQGDLERLALVLGALWILTTGIGALVALWLQRVVLRPLTGIAQAIAAVDPADLSARLAVDAVPQEMAAVTTRLNDLLGRLDAAFRRERSTIANIAHELRTPVAGLLMTIDLALSKVGPGPQGDALRRCHGIATTMQGMIANLLVLARIEAGQQPATPEPVGLDGLLREVWELQAPEATSRRIVLAWPATALGEVRVDRAHVRMILSNLCANAVAYAPPGSVLGVAGVRSGGSVILTLTNPTDGSLTDCAHVFEPFWRGDSARAVGLHCGLGLTLVQRLVAANGGQVTAMLTATREFQIALTLPAA